MISKRLTPHNQFLKIMATTCIINTPAGGVITSCGVCLYLRGAVETGFLSSPRCTPSSYAASMGSASSALGSQESITMPVYGVSRGGEAHSVVLTNMSKPGCSTFKMWSFISLFTQFRPHKISYHVIILWQENWFLTLCVILSVLIIHKSMWNLNI